MKLKCILINPWIYDFAAVNLWSKPLGLLRVAEYMSQFELDIRLIDCMDLFKERRHGTGKYPAVIVKKPDPLISIPRYFKRYGISIDDFIERFKNLLPCDFIFITSLMSYWYPGVQKAIEIVRTILPHAPVILGGIYATLYHEHAIKNSCADFVYKKHIGNNIITVLRKFGIRLKSNLTSLNFSKERQGGFSDEIYPQTPYYRLNLYKSYPFASILTSKGCPFRCSYCASKILYRGFIQREPCDVIKEIEYLYAIGVRDFAFYDDALLVNADSHIKVILKGVVKSGLNVRFHCPNGIHARFIDDELAYLMKESGFTTLRLGLETIDSERQLKTGGKITVDVFKETVGRLKRYGFTKREIGVYLMYGLPGQGLGEVKDGVTFLKDLDVGINLTEFSPIPETQCWKELRDKDIIDDNIDPLLTNNTVFSYLFSGYDPREIEKLKLDVKRYNAAIYK